MLSKELQGKRESALQDDFKEKEGLAFISMLGSGAVLGMIVIGAALALTLKLEAPSYLICAIILSGVVGIILNILRYYFRVFNAILIGFLGEVIGFIIGYGITKLFTIGTGLIIGAQISAFIGIFIAVYLWDALSKNKLP